MKIQAKKALEQEVELKVKFVNISDDKFNKNKNFYEPLIVSDE